MSGKLLHEKLREWASNRPFRFNEAWEDLGVAGNDNMLAAFADEIERQYVPVPRFPDGEPVRKGCNVDGGIVGGWMVWEDGAFDLYDEEGDTIQEGEPGGFAKRPEPKAIDASGTVTRRGDTVWLFDKVAGGPVCEPMKVTEVLCDGTLVFEGGGAMPARLVTHREPDSLEKLRDDMREAMESSPDAMFMDSRWVDRLTALMERGER